MDPALVGSMFDEIQGHPGRLTRASLASLNAASLVHSTWRPEAQNRLFEDMVCRTFCYSAKERMLDFLEFFQERPHLARRVRYLRWEQGREMLGSEQDSEAVKPLRARNPLLDRVFAMLPRLYHFGFFPRGSDAPSCANHLTSLSIHSVTLAHLRLWLQFCRLLCLNAEVEYVEECEVAAAPDDTQCCLKWLALSFPAALNVKELGDLRWILARNVETLQVVYIDVQQNYFEPPLDLTTAVGVLEKSDTLRILTVGQCALLRGWHDGANPQLLDRLRSPRLRLLSTEENWTVDDLLFKDVPPEARLSLWPSPSVSADEIAWYIFSMSWTLDGDPNIFFVGPWGAPVMFNFADLLRDLGQMDQVDEDMEVVQLWKARLASLHR